MKFGNANRGLFTAAIEVNGRISCRKKNFGGSNPAPNKLIECFCRERTSSTSESFLPPSPPAAPAPAPAWTHNPSVEDRFTEICPKMVGCCKGGDGKLKGNFFCSPLDCDRNRDDGVPCAGLWMKENCMKTCNVAKAEAFVLGNADVLSRTLEYGVDYFQPGSPSVSASSVEDCADLCRVDQICTHFSFAWSTCWLKTSAAGQQFNEWMISGNIVGKAAQVDHAADAAMTSFPVLKVEEASPLSCSHLGWGFQSGNYDVCGSANVPAANGLESKCVRNVDHSEAQARCHAAGARLCTADEIAMDAFRGAGCGLDTEFAWSSTRCGDGRFIVGLGSSKGTRTPECRRASVQTAAMACCADTTSHATVNHVTVNVPTRPPTIIVDPESADEKDASKAQVADSVARIFAMEDWNQQAGMVCDPQMRKFEAVKFCEAVGARLCSESDAHLPTVIGCDDTEAVTWTDEQCDSRMNWFKSITSRTGSTVSTTCMHKSKMQAAPRCCKVDAKPLKMPTYTRTCTIKEFTNFHGYDLPGGQHEVEIVNDCAEKCLARDDCSHFTVSSNMMCFLKSSGAGKKTSQKKTSGTCTLAVDTAFAPTTSQPVTAPSVTPQAGTVASSMCTIKSKVNFEGSDLPEGEHVVESLDQCALLCVGREECTHFTMSASLNCFLKSSGSGKKPSKKKTSGICREGTQTSQPVVANPTSCTIQKKTDYKGSDLVNSANKVASVDECADRCLANQQCTHFTMNAKMICYLKSSDKGATAAKMKTSGSCRDTAEPTLTEAPTHTPDSAPTDAPTTKETAPGLSTGCAVKRSTNFVGFDLKDGESQVETVSMCADQCMARSDCSHFTVSRSMKCFLKHSGAGGVKDKKKTSGVCREVPTEAPKPTCALQPNTDYSGHDVAGHVPQYVASVAACADNCIGHDKCTHFTIGASMRCFLKTSGAGKKISSKRTSGVCTSYDPRGIDVQIDAAVVGGPADPQACTIQNKVDFKGNDLPRSTAKAASADECGDRCLANKDCTHFSFTKSVCYLKRHSPSSGSHNKNSKSGICRTLA